MLTGLPFAALNRVSSKNVIRNGELLNYKKYYGPKYLDPYKLNHPINRPMSFYQALYQLEEGMNRRPRTVIKKIIKRKKS